MTSLEIWIERKTTLNGYSILFYSSFRLVGCPMPFKDLMIFGIDVYHNFLLIIIYFAKSWGSVAGPVIQANGMNWGLEACFTVFHSEPASVHAELADSTVTLGKPKEG